MRTALEIIVAAYLLGWIVLLASESRIRGVEWAALLAWPVLVPVSYAHKRYRHWRYTCPFCHRYYGSKKFYDLHMVHRTYCTREAGEA